jgi:uncharacterized protein
MAFPEFLGRGFKFPVRVNGRGGLSWSEGEESIAEAIWIILSTPRRSRVMEPEFGCGAYDYVFAPSNATTLAMIRNDVMRALVQFEARIDVLDVRVTAQADMPNLLMVEVDYRVRSNNASHNIVYPFHLNEGNA